ncbi:unnamed protein product [Urochloa decumbens]|uniref:Cullin N-terminal domain-containing protein n=1 Tax=Urochloa decumbens TaxID=240449 RepID=A0ABC9FGY9_9POAL
MERDDRIVGLEKGWSFVATGLAKIRRAIDDGGGEGLSGEEYMQVLTTVYCMCTQASPRNYSEQLYQRYKDDLDDYIKSTILPPLRELQGEILLRELVERWRKHNRIISFEINMFRYLNRYYISKRSLPSLQQISSSSFHDLVFNELKSSVTRTVIAMIDQEREGKVVDLDLLKNVLAIYIEIDSGKMGIYKADFEQAFLDSARNYYSSKAQSWNLKYSDDPDYMLKVEECLQKERERLANYLHSSTESKLVEAMKSELVTRRTAADGSMKKKNSG